MALTIRGRPVRFSLAWLKPPPMPPDGNMTLFEHLRELRYRLVLAAGSVIVAMLVCAIFYTWPHGGLFGVLTHPYIVAQDQLRVSKPELAVQMTINNVGGGLSLALKIVGAAGVVVASPIVLYQLWSFIVPGLLAKEKKWAVVFVGTATPLFMCGVVLGYFVMPKGIAVLLGFTPQNADVTNLIEMNAFLSFLIKLMIVFGIAFLIPAVVLLLNFLGVIPARYLAKFRMYIIFGCFVFGAVATPSTDPFSMLALALPMVILFLVSEIIARINDKRRAARSNDPDAVDTVLAQLQAEDAERRTTAAPAKTIIARRPSFATKVSTAASSAGAAQATSPPVNGTHGGTNGAHPDSPDPEPDAPEQDVVEPDAAEPESAAERPHTSSLDVDDFKSAIQALGDSPDSASVDESPSR